MNSIVDCAHECLATGTSCRLRHFALIHGLNLKLLERPSVNALTAFAYAQEEMVRLREKRQFMERLGIDCTDQVDCKQRSKVDEMEVGCRQREREYAARISQEIEERSAP